MITCENCQERINYVYDVGYPEPSCDECPSNPSNQDIIDNFLKSQESLGGEFQKVLRDNIDQLLVKT